MVQESHSRGYPRQAHFLLAIMLMSHALACFSRGGHGDGDLPRDGSVTDVGNGESPGAPDPTFGENGFYTVSEIAPPGAPQAPPPGGISIDKFNQFAINLAAGSPGSGDRLARLKKDGIPDLDYGLQGLSEQISGVAFNSTQKVTTDYLQSTVTAGINKTEDNSLKFIRVFDSGFIDSGFGNLGSRNSTARQRNYPSSFTSILSDTSFKNTMLEASSDGTIEGRQYTVGIYSVFPNNNGGNNHLTYIQRLKNNGEKDTNFGNTGNGFTLIPTDANYNLMTAARRQHPSDPSLDQITRIDVIGQSTFNPATLSIRRYDKDGISNSTFGNNGLLSIDFSQLPDQAHPTQNIHALAASSTFDKTAIFFAAYINNPSTLNVINRYYTVVINNNGIDSTYNNGNPKEFTMIAPGYLNEEHVSIKLQVNGYITIAYALHTMEADPFARRHFVRVEQFRTDASPNPDWKILELPQAKLTRIHPNIVEQANNRLILLLPGIKDPSSDSPEVIKFYTLIRLFNHLTH